MSRVFVHGLGAVSPAGWGVVALWEALEKSEPLPVQTLVRPGWTKPHRVRQVPTPVSRPPALGHARLRRTSPIAQFSLAAALEALGGDAARVANGSLRLGIITCATAGCVNYSKRFYDETLKDPSTASPLVFPETVFNAPASHLAAYFGSTETSYTLVGDDGTFLQGIAVAADWLLRGKVDGCIVVGADEMDWLVADALRLFTRTAIHGEGAGALYLRAEPPSPPGAELATVTDAHSFTARLSRTEAALRMRAELPTTAVDEIVLLGTQGVRWKDAAEESAWSDWTGARLAPKALLGEAFPASAAWQCVAACEAIRRGQFAAANVSVVGANQQAIGARFVTASPESDPQDSL